MLHFSGITFCNTLIVIHKTNLLKMEKLPLNIWEGAPCLTAWETSDLAWDLEQEGVPLFHSSTEKSWWEGFAPPHCTSAPWILPFCSPFWYLTPFFEGWRTSLCKVKETFLEHGLNPVLWEHREVVWKSWDGNWISDKLSQSWWCFEQVLAGWVQGQWHHHDRLNQSCWMYVHQEVTKTINQG